MHIARTTARILAALALLLGAATAQAAITVGSPDGWNLTVGGFVNVFVVDDSGDVSPHGDLYGRTVKDSTIRIRTGLLPGLIGFSLAAPEVDGIKTAARVGLYPQVNGNAGARTTISGANIDLRELNFTVEGSFGQFLVGRALTLYQGKNILTDMSLFGVGVPSTVAFDNGPALGHIGIGYLYPSFDAQVRYTTPDLSGVKLAVAIVDPSNVAAGAALKATSDAGSVLGSPTFEAELSFAGKSDAVSYQAFASGVYQSSKVGTTDVTSAGGAGGLSVGFSGLDLLASGFIGSAVGASGVINSSYTLDSVTKARTTAGVLAQATYTIGKTKLGVNYSHLGVTQTSQDKLDYAASSGAAHDAAVAQLDSRQAITGGVWYDLVPSVKLVAEFTHLDLKFADASKAGSNVVSVGGFIFF
jgi:predicted porin